MADERGSGSSHQMLTDRRCCYRVQIREYSDRCATQIFGEDLARGLLVDPSPSELRSDGPGERGRGLEEQLGDERTVSALVFAELLVRMLGGEERAEWNRIRHNGLLSAGQPITHLRVSII